MTVLYIIIAILIFGVLIAIHEFDHGGIEHEKASVDPRSITQRLLLEAHYAAALKPDALKHARIGVLRNAQGKQPDVDSAYDRALDAMEGAVTADKKPNSDEAKKEQQIKKRVWMIYGGVVGVVLIVALLLRGLIH